MQKIIYNGSDITEYVSNTSCIACDNAGGVADDISLVFSIPQNLNCKIEPKREDKILFIKDFYNSGTMYVDKVTKTNGSYIIDAISIPLNAKNKRSKVWRNITLIEIYKDIAKKYNLNLRTFYIKDYSYKCVSQNNESDFSFLNRISKREGYTIKIYNNNLIIFNELQLEQSASSQIINLKTDTQGNFFETAYELLQKFVVRYFDINKKQLIEGIFEDNEIIGSEKSIVEFVSDENEAKRFAKGYLRNFNKNKITGKLIFAGITEITAGSIVSVNSDKLFKGKYIVSKSVYDFNRNISTFYIRKCNDKY